MDKKNIAIIGGGPIGVTVAAHLGKVGHHITVCDVNTEIREKLSENGAVVTGVRELTSKVDRIIANIDEIPEIMPDILFIAVKATALPLICSAVAEFYDKKMTVVSWQNGIDTERIIAETLGNDTVVRGLINHGVSFKEPGKVFMAFEQGAHAIQELNSDFKEKTEELAELLTDAGLVTKRSDNLVSAVWTKTVLNASLNALCALSGMNLKEAVNDPYTKSLYDNILKESIRVARANEITLGWDFYRWATDYLSKVGEHKPSMLMDVEAGRRTEIDFINGKIKEYGGYAGIDTPYNDSLISLIKAKEKMLLKKK